MKQWRQLPNPHRGQAKISTSGPTGCDREASTSHPAIKSVAWLSALCPSFPAPFS
ncbi:unnamed protein product [Acidithrix sp. C25]|nr:unnamed protein product [Acidithrix sp. C25]